MQNLQAAAIEDVPTDLREAVLAARYRFEKVRALHYAREMRGVHECTLVKFIRARTYL